MIRTHRKAVEAMVSGVTLYVGEAPAGTAAPYVVLHFAPGLAESTSMAVDSDWRNWSFVSHAVGRDVEQAQWVLERLEAAWLDARPVVAGRTCRPVRHISGVPPEVDNDESPALTLARDYWAFDSIPA